MGSACCPRKITSFIHLVNTFWRSNWHWDPRLSMREGDNRKYWNNVSSIRFPRSRVWDKDLRAYNLLRELVRAKEKQNKTGEGTQAGYGDLISARDWFQLDPLESSGAWTFPMKLVPPGGSEKAFCTPLPCRGWRLPPGKVGGLFVGV